MKKNQSKEEIANQIDEIKKQLKPHQKIIQDLSFLEKKLEEIRKNDNQKEILSDPKFVKYVEDLLCLLSDINSWQPEIKAICYIERFNFNGVDTSPEELLCIGDCAEYFGSDLFEKARELFNKTFESRINRLVKTYNILVKKYDKDLFKKTLFACSTELYLG